MKNLQLFSFQKLELKLKEAKKVAMISFSFILFIAFAAYIQSAKAESTSWLNSGTNMYSNMSGNVGIGNITPTTKLDITGIVRSKNTSNGAANYLLQTSTGNYTFGLATTESNLLYIGRSTSTGGTLDDLVVGNGISSKASSNGASTFVNTSNDNSTKFGEAVVNGPSVGTGTYYFGLTSSQGSGIYKTYIKIDNNTGTMCLGNC